MKEMFESGKNYKELLKQQSQKKSLFFSIIEKESFFTGLAIVAMLLVALLIGQFAVYSKIYQELILEGDPEWSAILCSVLVSLLVGLLLEALTVVVMASVITVVVVLANFILVEIPCRANRRYLPLTSEEIRALNLNVKEFAEFCESISSRKMFPNSKELSYASGMFEDVKELMRLYCTEYCTEYDLIEKREGGLMFYKYNEISQYFSHDFKVKLEYDFSELL